MATQPTPEPTLVTRKAAVDAANAWLVADAAAKVAKTAAEKARVALVATISESDGEVVHVPAEQTVAVSDRNRRAVPLDELRDHATTEVIKEVTVLKVDLALFDAAVKLGHITSEVAEAVTVNTAYTDVRVVK